MTMTENELQDGRVVGIAGPVIDVEFPRGALPEINTALEFDVTLEGEQVSVLAEVNQPGAVEIGRDGTLYATVDVLSETGGSLVQVTP